MFTSDLPIVLTEAERTELEARSRSRSLPSADVQRARLILLLAAAVSWREICGRLVCSQVFIGRWKLRFLAERLEGLYPRHQGSRRQQTSLRTEARILKATMQPPTDGATHWSTRRLASKLGVNHMQVARAWANAGLQPHRMQRYVASNDPDFEARRWT